MDRAILAGAAFGLLFGAFFAASFFDQPWAGDVAGGSLLALLVLAAFTLPAWSPASRPFPGGLRFGGAAAVALLLSWLALAGTGFVSVSAVWWRAVLAFAAMLVAFALMAAALACVSWLGGRVVRRGPAA